jgi:hypothetical protein
LADIFVVNENEFLEFKKRQKSKKSKSIENNKPYNMRLTEHKGNETTKSKLTC